MTTVYRAAISVTITIPTMALTDRLEVGATAVDSTSPQRRGEERHLCWV